MLDSAIALQLSETQGVRETQNNARDHKTISRKVEFAGRWSMIRKSGYRFSEKIMLKQDDSG